MTLSTETGALPYAQFSEEGTEPSVSITIPRGGKTYKNDYKNTSEKYLGRFTLRTGCIIVTGAYFIYTLLFLMLSLVQILPDPSYHGTENIVAPIGLSPYNDLFCAFLGVIIIERLIQGIKRKSPYYLHIAKWLMIVDFGFAIFESIQLAIIGAHFIFMFHLIIQFIPIHFIQVTNSYEGELVYLYRERLHHLEMSKEAVLDDIQSPNSFTLNELSFDQPG